MNLPLTLPFQTAAIAAAVSLTAGTVAGWRLHDALVHRPHLAADAVALRKAADRARAAEVRGTAIATAVRDAADTRQARIRTVTQTLLKEVPRYVSATVQCPSAASVAPGAAPAPLAAAPRIAADVTVGFGLLHDAAARGAALPAAAGVDLDAPRGAGMPAVAGTIVANYGVCRAWRDEAGAWRDWYVRQRDAWPVK
jgi:hypothetical protein